MAAETSGSSWKCQGAAVLQGWRTQMENHHICLSRTTGSCQHMLSEDIKNLSTIEYIMHISNCSNFGSAIHMSGNRTNLLTSDSMLGSKEVGWEVIGKASANGKYNILNLYINKYVETWSTYFNPQRLLTLSNSIQINIYTEECSTYFDDQMP